MNSSSQLFAPRISSALLTAGLLLGSVLQVGCSSTSNEQADYAEVLDAIRHGEFEQSVKLAEALTDAPGAEGERAREIHRIATVAFYLDMGRQASFRWEDDLALEWFARAKVIAPNSERVSSWIGKTKLQRADDFLLIGNEAFASDKFQEAAAAYNRCLEYVPGYPLALAGLGSVTILINYRIGLGEEYYTQGVRALADYRLRSAQHRFASTAKYIPKKKVAVSRAAEVDELLAGQRVEIALGFEEEGLFAGAMNEFRFALALDEDNSEAKAGMERLASEVEAAQILRDARMEIYRQEYDDALEILDSGESLTIVQKDEFLATREEIVSAKLERQYQAALNLEYDGDFEGAILLLAALLKEVDHYADALARKSTLEGYVKMAANYYKKAKSEKNKELKLEHLRSIEGFWPDYKDIKRQISRLE
ncbi:MAG: tetratricopeptide (TPR) repeat protein [Planctomycetota bacterium]|jgi:tetratricopeptide (TPR) repeat protein